jgi:hypothetical protein
VAQLIQTWIAQTKGAQKIDKGWTKAPRPTLESRGSLRRPIIPPLCLLYPCKRPLSTSVSCHTGCKMDSSTASQKHVWFFAAGVGRHDKCPHMSLAWRLKGIGPGCLWIATEIMVKQRMGIWIGHLSSACCHSAHWFQGRGPTPMSASTFKPMRVRRI